MVMFLCAYRYSFRPTIRPVSCSTLRYFELINGVVEVGAQGLGMSFHAGNARGEKTSVCPPCISGN